MRTIYFATSNPAKATEAAHALMPFGIKVKHLKASKPEEQDQPIEVIAAKGAQFLARKYRKPIVVEDTGMFFDAYPGFPGPLAKPVMTYLKVEGILRLLRGKKRTASLRTAVGYCEPGKRPLVFVGIAKGRIPARPAGAFHPSIPYDVIFIPEGHAKTYAQLPDVKSRQSQRARAFQKLGRYLRTK